MLDQCPMKIIDLAVTQWLRQFDAFDIRSNPGRNRRNADRIV
jgi:hypothetical protein